MPESNNSGSGEATLYDGNEFRNEHETDSDEVFESDHDERNDGRGTMKDFNRTLEKNAEDSVKEFQNDHEADSDEFFVTDQHYDQGNNRWRGRFVVKDFSRTLCTTAKDSAVLIELNDPGSGKAAVEDFQDEYDLGSDDFSQNGQNHEEGNDGQGGVAVKDFKRTLGATAGDITVLNISNNSGSGEVDVNELQNEYESDSDIFSGNDQHHEEGSNLWGRGIVKDFNSALGNHWKDEMTNFNLKMIGVSIFMYFAAAAPALSFGAVYATATNNNMGALEMITATACCGIVYGFIGGQPMMINGGTGPVLSFSTVLFESSEIVEIPFRTLHAWTGLWICFFLFFAAFVDMNRMVKHFTRFTDEIFAMLIIGIFIIDALGNPYSKVGVFWYFSPDHKSHVKFKGDESYSHHAAALLSVILTFGTTAGAVYLRGMKHSRFFPNQTMRNIVCDFAVAINIVFWTTIATLLSRDVPTETLYVPDKFAPTFQCCNASCHTSFPDDCPDQEEAWGRRPWLVDLMDFGGKRWVPLFAVVPGMLGFSLIFFDNGITWHLINHPCNKLKHGHAYNYDTLVIGLMIAINSLFGLPWLVAATVRSITHVQAMAEKDTRGKIVLVQETRLTHIFIHVFVLVTIFALQVLKLIPVPVLYGVFLFMGISSLSTSELWQRFKMLLMQPSRLPDEPFTKYMPHKRMHMFTIIQVSLFVCLIVTRSIPLIAIAFPTIFKACIPIRKYLLPLWFSEEELTLLDAEHIEIKRLVKTFKREGHEEAAVTPDEHVIEKAAMDFADEHTRI